VLKDASRPRSTAAAQRTAVSWCDQEGRGRGRPTVSTTPTWPRRRRPSTWTCPPAGQFERSSRTQVGVWRRIQLPLVPRNRRFVGHHHLQGFVGGANSTAGTPAPRALGSASTDWYARSPARLSPTITTCRSPAAAKTRVPARRSIIMKQQGVALANGLERIQGRLSATIRRSTTGCASA